MTPEEWVRARVDPVIEIATRMAEDGDSSFGSAMSYNNIYQEMVRELVEFAACPHCRQVHPFHSTDPFQALTERAP